MASNSNKTSIKAPGTSHPFTFEVSFTEGAISEANNNSPISITASMTSTGASWSGSSQHTLVIYWIDDNEHKTPTQVGSLALTSLGTNAKKSVSGSITVNHKSDGKLNGYARAVFTKVGSSSYVPPSTTLDTPNTTLTTIPRTSSFNATNAEIEGSCNITINRAAAFTHTLKYKFGSLSGTIASGVATSYSWTIPTSFYAQIPNAKSGTCTITCETYSGSTKIGETSKTITISCNESKCRPTISAVLEDVNSKTLSLTEDNQKIVKGYSNVKITPSATAKNSATIKSITVERIATSNNTPVTINNASSAVFSLSVTDSRGFTTQSSISGTLIDYIILTCKAKAYRPVQTEPNVTLDFEGNYFNASFGSVDNTLSLSWAYREKGSTEWIGGGTLSPTLSGNTYKGSTSVGSNYDYRKDYDFLVAYADKLESLNVIASVSKGIFDFEIYTGAILAMGEVISYDAEKYKRNEDGSFSKL